MSTLPGRSIRRRMLKANGFFKSKSELSFKERVQLTEQTRERGTEYSNTNADAMDKNIAEQLEAKEVALISAWKESGYDDKEIELLRTAHAIYSVKNRSSWKEDKKIAKDAINAARQSFIKRTT